METTGMGQELLLTLWDRSRYGYWLRLNASRVPTRLGMKEACFGGASEQHWRSRSLGLDLV